MSNETRPELPVAPTTKSNCMKTAGITCLVLFIVGIAVVFWIVSMMSRQPTIRKAYTEARLIAQCQINLQEVGGALDRYHKRNGKYPATLAELYPTFLEEKGVLHCPSDTHKKDVVSYDYTPPEETAPPTATVVECKRHVVIEGQPPWTLFLRKDGIVDKQGYMPRQSPR